MHKRHLQPYLLSIDSRPGARGHAVWCLIIAEPRRPKHLDARANENGPRLGSLPKAPRTMFQSCETSCEISPPNDTDHPSHQTSTTSPTFRLESSLLLIGSVIRSRGLRETLCRKIKISQQERRRFTGVPEQKRRNLTSQVVRARRH